jgi:hypothetical protein
MTSKLQKINIKDIYFIVPEDQWRDHLYIFGYPEFGYINNGDFFDGVKDDEVVVSFDEMTTRILNNNY